MEFKIAVLPGDGIGPEVTAQGIKVLNAVGAIFKHSFETSFGNIGGNSIDDFDTPLPEETVNICEKSDAILFGAVGGPKWDNLDAKNRPEDGILSLRKRMDLFANLRPVKLFPELKNSSPLKSEFLNGVDMVVVRELTSGLYFGKPKRRWTTSKGRRGVDTMKYTEEEIERILRVGFQTAQNRRKLLTSVDKANVLESSRLWREIAKEMSSKYPDVHLEHIYVDNMSMQMIKNPSHFDVIVAENTFGDIISDEAGVLSGSLGMLPSASLTNSGTKNAVFGLYEPVHGSAPDIAGQDIANPIAMILSTTMMLRHSLNLNKEAKAVEKSVATVLGDGYRTSDIANKGEQVSSTIQMGDAITECIYRNGSNTE